ncbi:hypothetical protein M0R01_01385 [bacterium]|nr:hypothetical protein [bacterium]
MAQQPLDNRNSGFVVLIVILIFNAIGIMIAISLLFKNSLFLDNISSLEGLAKARSFATTCSEEALLSIKNGTEINDQNINFGDGKCSYEIIKNEKDFFIKTRGVYKNFFSKEFMKLNKDGDKLKIIYYHDDF